MENKLSRREFIRKTAVIGGIGLLLAGCKPASNILTPPAKDDAGKTSPDNTSVLFNPVKIGQIQLKNRLVRSATAERMADETGAVTDRMVILYDELAKGGVGTIITGHCFTREDGRSGLTMMGLHDDKMIEGVNRLAKVLHQFDAKLFVQLNHVGANANPKIIGKNPLAPSADIKSRGQRKSKEMAEDDIKEVVESFGSAAKRAQAGGADGVQIHAAHGFLISQFLSPKTNKRTDAWGGSPEKRANFLLAVYKQIRSSVGSDFPVWVKFNGCEFGDGGMTVEDGLVAVKKLEEAGINAVEISGAGKGKDKEAGIDGEAYFLPQAERYRAEIKIPLMLVGGIRSKKAMETLVTGKKIDLISMCRPFIKEPDLALNMQNGLITKSKCISCGACAGNNDVSIKCWT